LCLLFNKIGDKGRTGSVWKQRGGGKGRVWGAEGRNDPNNVCTYEYMNKEKKDIFAKSILAKFPSYFMGRTGSHILSKPSSVVASKFSPRRRG
jgi:hypothetical protein